MQFENTWCYLRCHVVFTMIPVEISDSKQNHSMIMFSSAMTDQCLSKQISIRRAREASAWSSFHPAAFPLV